MKRRTLLKAAGSAVALSIFPFTFSGLLKNPLLNHPNILEKENLQSLCRRTAQVIQVKWDELPWKVDANIYKKLNQKWTLFSRTGWNPETQQAAAKTPASMLRNMREASHSTLLDYALSGAGWWVAIKGAANLMDFGDGGLVSWESKMPPTFSVAADSWKANPELQKLQAQFKAAMQKKPAVLTKIVKKVAMYLGADLVGVAPYDDRWTYSHRVQNPRYHPGEPYKEEPLEIPKEIKYAIVLAFAEDYAMQETAEGGPSMGDIGFGYSKMAIGAGSLAEFLRCLGYMAIPTGNDTALSIPYAIAAGLGEYSRMGLIITPEYGPRIRLAKVFTDAPLITDQPIRFGVYEFCKTCKKCAKACPAGAIPLGDPTWEAPTESNNPGVWKWYVDPIKCFEYWCVSGTPGCGICVRVCPYNKPKWWLHEVFRDYFATLVGGETGKNLDDALGYGTKRPSKEWWEFDYKQEVGGA
ncbi:MAG: reductive dehalogenase [Nitrososphaerales archaeon]